MIKPSNNQTKEWRKSQLWCLNGKHNACGRYQKSIIKGITKPTINKAHRLQSLKRFNGCQGNNGKIIYYNFKMISGSGGAQIRILREVYHFVSTQQRYLSQEPNPNILFINILDGDENYKKRKCFNILQTQQKFIGSLFE